jgi:hypothetical protein
MFSLDTRHLFLSAQARLGNRAGLLSGRPAEAGLECAVLKRRACGKIL